MKLLAIVSILSVLVTATFGQGSVNFANVSGAQNVSTNWGVLSPGTSGLVSGSGIAPLGYYYALLAQPYAGSGPTVDSTLASLLSDGWIYTGVTGSNALGAGRIAGGANSLTTAGMPVGDPNQFIVVGWSSSAGTTWAVVSTELESGDFFPTGNNIFIGVSSVGTGVGVDSPPEAIFGGTGGIQTGFNLYPVIPEPATFALAGLGGLALLAFRRRK
jgi:hypothetical protein